MLQLFLERAESMGSDGGSLSGSISLLKQTSRLIAIFHDPRPISVPSGDRLAQLITIGEWFKDWEKTIMADISLSGKAKRAMLLSPETREDTESSIRGFVSFVEHRYGTCYNVCVSANTYIIYNTISICKFQCMRLCKYLIICNTISICMFQCLRLCKYLIICNTISICMFHCLRLCKYLIICNTISICKFQCLRLCKYLIICNTISICKFQCLRICKFLIICNTISICKFQCLRLCKYLIICNTISICISCQIHRCRRNEACY